MVRGRRPPTFDSETTPTPSSVKASFRAGGGLYRPDAGTPASSKCHGECGVARSEVYGRKCYLCQHLAGPTHDTDPVWPAADDDCPRCGFCQENAFIGALIRQVDDLTPGGIFAPEVRAATKAVFAGKPHPLIDRLRAELNDG